MTFEDGSQALIKDMPDAQVTVTPDNPAGGVFKAVSEQLISVADDEEWKQLNEKFPTHHAAVDKQTHKVIMTPRNG